MIRALAWFLMSSETCLCSLDCTTSPPARLDLYAVNTQGALIFGPDLDKTVPVGGAVGVGTMATGRGGIETVLRHYAHRSVGDAVAKNMQARLESQMSITFTQMSDPEIAAVLFGDTVAPTLILGGIVMLYNYETNDQWYTRLMHNAQMSLDQLETAYGTLVLRFLALPHPLSLLQHQDARPLLCGWKEAAENLNQVILDAQGNITRANDRIANCWIWCETPIPDEVIVDLQDVARDAADLKLVFNSFIDCYPFCPSSTLTSDWNSIDNDAWGICEGVRRATCGFPDNKVWCRNAEHRPCRRWSTTSTPVLTLPELPPQQLTDGTALTESDSCGRSSNNFSDVKKLARCTQDLMAAQQSVLVEQKHQISVFYHGALAVLIASWFAVFCCGSGAQGRRREAPRPAAPPPPPVFGSHDADVYRHMGDDNGVHSHIDDDKPIWQRLVTSIAKKYLPPVALTLSATAIGIAIASKWALETNLEMIQSVQLWLDNVVLDLGELEITFASHPEDLVFANFSLLANDISTAVAMAVQNSWQSQLPALSTVPI